MFFAKPPLLLRKLYPKLVWQIPTDEKNLYLSFDDGPIPEVTPWVLETLNQYNAKATFFCVGNNISKYPEIYSEILNNGHSTGNHSFNHINGWKTSNKIYFEEVEKCEKEIENSFLHTPDPSEKEGKLSLQIRNPKSLFRPPYGKITPSQYSFLNKKYKIIMWDVLSGDYDATISNEQCLNHTIKYSKNGSIIVFHDSLKAENNLRFTLPKMLEYFTDKGFQFKGIDANCLF